MSDFTPTWLDEPYPLDHTITWREHYARKEHAEHLEWRIWHEDRMYEQNGPRHE